MPLSELIHELGKRTDIKQATIYQTIHRLDLVELQPDPRDSRRRLVKYLGASTAVAKGSRKTIREVVQEETEKFLRNQPGHRALVADVANHVVKTVKCNEHTFHTYLSQMESLRKEKIDNKLYCLLKPGTAASTLVFPRIEEVESEPLKENLYRATRNLNVENVDMGLFQLGKIFDLCG